MRQSKIIARILLILPIINFAFALPLQETRQVRGNVVPDVAITMSAKRGDEMGKQWDTYFKRLSGKPESSSESAAHPPSGSVRSDPDDEPINGPASPPQSPASESSTAPDHGSTDPPQMGTSEIQEESPEELSRTPSLDHYVMSPEELERTPSLDHYVMTPEELERTPSLDHYVVSPEPLSKPPSSDHYVVSESPEELSRDPSLDHHMASPGPEAPLVDHSDTVTDPGSDSIESAVSEGTANEGAGSSTSTPTAGSSTEKPKSKGFLTKAVMKKLRKIKFWRRISGPEGVARSG
ncbi:hypothetical protein F5888DRAFT_1801348 [Russula emetica]|nr:hypothetical protein F5888DRAFT_1801348 [Russula emetica]